LHQRGKRHESGIFCFKNRLSIEFNETNYFVFNDEPVARDILPVTAWIIPSGIRTEIDNVRKDWQTVSFIASTEIAYVATYHFDIGAIAYLKLNVHQNEFITEFADRPELIENVTPEILPPSYRVKPNVGDADVIEALAAQFDARPGVRQVTLPVEVIRTLQQNSQKVSVFVLIIAIVVLLAALMLIANTIRTAIFARRQDIEVMKLVGASNWYVRLPFMVEGTIQGLIGGALAIPMLFLMNNLMAGFVQDDYLELLRSLVVDSAVVWNTSLLVTGIGAAVGVAGSLFAVGRFLDV